MHVECLAPVHMTAVWERVRPMIDRGYAAGDELMPEDVLDRLLDGRTQLWVAIDDEGEIHAAMTTDLVPMRSGLVCWMGQCGGERLRDWAPFHRKVEEYARAEGCVKTILRGREGWGRVLGGYKVRTVQLEKVL